MRYTISLSLLFFSLHFVQGQSRLPVTATTRFGDRVGTLDGMIKAYYDVVTVKKGQRPSYQRDSCLHMPGALVGGTNLNSKGQTGLHPMTLRRYHELEDAELARDGFYERELTRKVENFRRHLSCLEHL